MRNSLQPKINQSFRVEEFDGEVLLFNDTTVQGIYLNNEAHAVWLLCKENMNVGQIIQYLEEMYPDQKEQVRGDVVSALQTLLGHSVIELTDEE